MGARTEKKGTKKCLTVMWCVAAEHLETHACTKSLTRICNL